MPPETNVRFPKITAQGLDDLHRRLGVKITDTLVLPAFGAMVLSWKAKLPATCTLFPALVAMLPLRLEAASVWP